MSPVEAAVVDEVTQAQASARAAVEALQACAWFCETRCDYETAVDFKGALRAAVRAEEALSAAAPRMRRRNER